MARILTEHALSNAFYRRSGSSRNSLVPGSYKPGASTTGALASVLPELNLPSATTLIITEAGTTYQNLTIYGDILIRAANVTLKGCILKGGSHAPGNATGIVDCNAAQCFNAVIEDCTVSPQVPHYNRDGIVGHEYTSRRNNISRTTDGLGAFITTALGTDCNVLIEANYVHDLTYFYPDVVHTDGTHNDCLQIQGGANIHVIGNYFHGSSVMGAGSQPNPDKPRLLGETPSFINGSGTIIQKQSTTAALVNVVVEKNWYQGGLAGLNLKPGTYTCKNNYFGREWYDYNADNPGRAASMFPIRGDDSTTTFVTGLLTSNRWEDTNALMAGVINGGTRDDGIRWNDIID